MTFRVAALDGLLAAVVLIVGCGSGAETLDPEPPNPLWRDSSTDLLLESWSYADNPLSGAPISSNSRCTRYPRSRMSAAQIDYLRSLEPREVELLSYCDGGRGTVVSIVEADFSVTSFKTDDSTAGCVANRIEVALPAAIKEHFSDGLACVACGPSNPCVEGTCVQAVCVNF